MIGIAMIILIVSIVVPSAPSKHYCLYSERSPKSFRSIASASPHSIHPPLGSLLGSIHPFFDSTNPLLDSIHPALHSVHAFARTSPDCACPLLQRPHFIARSTPGDSCFIICHAFCVPKVAADPTATCLLSVGGIRRRRAVKEEPLVMHGAEWMRKRLRWRPRLRKHEMQRHVKILGHVNVPIRHRIGDDCLGSKRRRRKQGWGQRIFCALLFMSRSHGRWWRFFVGGVADAGREARPHDGFQQSLLLGHRTHLFGTQR
mmetsp:Transcript_43497/g.87966  ORF Transcript_43497/g.87966 Transcript_43497/m.87966 type:complete len:259 (+) Transcript_43497:401-1177(+)